MRPLLSAAFVLLIVFGSPAEAQRVAAAEIVPDGILRVGFQTASPILARRTPDGSVSGVVVDLGKFVAERLGAAFVAVVYVNQEAYLQSFGKGEWDVVMGVRSSLTNPSPDFMVADARYIAAPGREFASTSNIDSVGVKVGVSLGGGSDQFLTRALKSAEVVRVSGGVSNAVAALRDGKVDVWAANPVTLQEIEDALPGSRVVPGAWTTGRYAVSLPNGRSAAAHALLADIVTEAKRTGVVQRSIDQAGFKSVHVAPE